ncbi:nitroreductase family deazaflavin-dependent oxidoreductase [Lolliginicoccus suaedae]|uniref:nitroreductase family deazaflavin-dependent oxidoreductase n=1 Tax=Lolliginicoccus suaedae TaxID=2605429 RepID=UPI0011F049BD|nr:nitroreductase family deazaflavin-dependent oxidoreductase [Lolliginicoccus suaedae]
MGQAQNASEPSLPARPTGLRRLAFRLPILLYKLRLGFILGERFMLLRHMGRKSGQLHETVVEVVARDPAEGSWTVAAAFGPKTDWYRNLRKHPATTVQVGGREFRVMAAFPDAEIGGEIMVRYAHAHPAAAKRIAAFLGHAVDGGPDDYRNLGQAIPFAVLTAM